MRSSVLDNARQLGLELNVVRLPDAASLAEAAAVIGCAEGRMASCSVYVGDGDPIVCIGCETLDVDRDRLAEVLDVAELRVASASEVRAATGYPLGGVPPFGHGLPVVIERSLLAHATVWAAAGDGSTVVEIEPERLVDCTRATVAAISA